MAADCVPPREMIGNLEVRKLAGGITRHTLIAWRRDHEFPAPVARIPAAGSPCEVWDAREVRAWLRARERARRRK